jgi:hypothetical protein
LLFHLPWEASFITLQLAVARIKELRQKELVLLTREAKLNPDKCR